MASTSFSFFGKIPGLITSYISDSKFVQEENTSAAARTVYTNFFMLLFN
ncbi:hypothetical protein Barb6_02611 [Bacteroidales bacterium Barb6]|nr:hypothetical protein Barb6_02611 [Bacteroidales bacterium Barb6]